MKASKHIHHTRGNFRISYPVSLGQRLYSLLLTPVILVVLLFLFLKFFSHTAFSLNLPLGINAITIGVLLTMARLLVAYILAIVVAIPLALLVTLNDVTEKIFLPIFDILESVPTLAFFPILIIFFVEYNFLNGAAIFILFLSMLWNIVFTLVGGLKIIPTDIKYAAEVFGIKGWNYFTKVLLPAIFPQIVTGSILAVAQGWNIIIVAEVLHTYIPHGTSANDLFGIGSILVNAAAMGQNNVFVVAIFMMVLAIAFLNFFVWQKLIHYAERFKFE